MPIDAETSKTKIYTTKLLNQFVIFSFFTGLHDLRHSNATALIQAGVNPRVVQQRLGHSDVNITLNTYTHVLPEMDVEAAEKLESILLKRAQ